MLDVSVWLFLRVSVGLLRLFCVSVSVCVCTCLSVFLCMRGVSLSALSVSIHLSVGLVCLSVCLVAYLSLDLSSASPNACCFAAITRKSRIIDVVYNASNNELVRTKTLVKNCIVQVDSTPFRQWFEAHYGLPLGRKKAALKELVSLLNWNMVVGYTHGDMMICMEMMVM